MTTPMTWQYRFATPLGPTLARSDGDAVTALAFHPVRAVPPAGETIPAEARALFARLHRELDEYFAGQRKRFTVACAPAGTVFQQAVWAALAAIPCGATTSYAEIARRVGRPRAVRAVGAANGRNPVAILVPCHRVIGSDGTLTGYAGGLERKARLLAHERDSGPRTRSS
jgi:methylated-DNA-[protein]-cysteine S-methyltransferase